MAYSTKGRDPLLPAETQAALEKRTKELIGLALMGGAVVLGLILGTYSPLDPSFFGRAVGDPANLFGYTGAYAASAMLVVFGQASWGVVLALAVWGVRFFIHAGADRVVARLVFLPVWLIVVSVYSASHVPGAGWTHSFGLGGMFGDMALALLISLVPLAVGTSLKLLAVILAVVTVVFGLFCLAFSRAEVRRFRQFMVLGLLYFYDALARGVGRAGRAAAHGAARGRDAALTRKANRAARAEQAADLSEHGADEDWSAFEEGDWEPEQVEPPAPTGFLQRLPMLRPRSGAEQQAIEADVEPFDGDDLDEDQEGRVQARISGAIKARIRRDRMKLAAERTRQEPTLGAAVGAEAGPVPPLTATELEEDVEPPMFFRPKRPDPFIEVDVPDPDPSDFEADEVSAPLADAASIPKFLSEKAVIRGAPSKSPKPSTRAKAEAQPSLRLEANEEPEAYEPPPLALLRDPALVEKHFLSDEALQENARMLETVLDDYGIKGDIVSVRPGPVVTMYELEPAPGLKASRVIGLSDDIARSMSALSARVSTVPGRTVIGIELPNERREMVLLREILSARDFGDSKLRLPLALGKDIGGAPIVANLAKMPHLLIAGTTGSGKSVAINTMILSLLYKLSPDECRLIMIDPKMLELSVYDGIPHLLSPVVTDPKKAVVALKWVVGEMEDRYRKMSKMGVRNIEGYNGRVREALGKGEMFTRTVQTGFDDDTGDPVFETEEIQPELLPFIVVIVDEMADLMMVAGKEIEACIQRLAQMARASGIHLIMATQRPSVDVITGTIKANFPTRISFQVTSKVDSRTILGEMGAEQLLGMGDMLYMAGGAKITRVHGPFASDEEVEEVVNNLKAYGPPDYVGGVVDGPDEEAASDIDVVLGLGGNTNGEDALYDQAVAIVIKDRKCSTSYIQRKLGIGYNKAARLVEQMEDEGLVSPANHVGKREILVPEQA
ncbi:MAG: DNA translocase FtsK 4TM domain-containing protein [Pseudomonadota bacterium]